MPYAIAGVVVFVLLVAGGVELDDLMHEYPGQFYMGVFATLFIAVGCSTALLRRAARGGHQVPLVRELPPLPKAIQAVPVMTAAAVTAGPQEEVECERQDCDHRVVPKAAWGVRLEGEAREHLFCSEWCAQAWDSARVS